jgi:hypothetical protein
MKIYRVGTTWRDCANYSSYDVLARNADEAVRKVKKQFIRGERLETITCLAKSEY